MRLISLRPVFAIVVLAVPLNAEQAGVAKAYIARHPDLKRLFPDVYRADPVLVGTARQSSERAGRQQCSSRPTSIA